MCVAGLAVKLVARVLWIYSFLTLSLILAVCAFPGVLFAHWVYVHDTFWGWTPPGAAKLFLLTFAVTLGYFIMGITMMLLLPVLRILMGAKTGEGRVPIRSFKVWSWYRLSQRQVPTGAAVGTNRFLQGLPEPCAFSGVVA